MLESDAVDALDGGVFDIDEAGGAGACVPDADGWALGAEGEALGSEDGRVLGAEGHSAQKTVYSAMTNLARSLQRLRPCWSA